MKKHLLLIVICCSLLQLFSFAQGTTVKKSTAYAYDFNLRLTSDSSFIFVGDEGIASVEHNQTFNWYKSVPVPRYFTNFDILKNSDSTFFTFGAIPGTTSYMAAFSIFNKNGTFKPVKFFPSLCIFHKALPMNKNTILAQVSTNYNAYVYDFGLMKLNNGGTPLLTKKISPVFEVYLASYGFVLNKINENLFLATTYSYDFSTKQKDLITFAVDSSLNVLWAKMRGGKRDEVPICTLDLNGKHFTICQTTSFGAGKNDILIVCTSNSGTVLWNKTIGSELDEYPLKVSLDKDSSLLISGYVKKDLNELGLLLKVTQEGEPVWAKTYDPMPGYQYLRMYDTYVNRFGNISAAFGISTQVSSRPLACFMDLQPSGGSVCAGKSLLVKQKTVILTEKEVAATSTVLNPVASDTSGTNPNIPETMNTWCANACTTKANMHFSKSRICKGSSITFINTSSDNDSIRWLMDGTKMSNTTNFSPTFTTAGNHVVSLVAFGASCKDTIAANITVDDVPVADFSYTQKNLEGQFTNLSVGALTDTWMMGDGTLYSSIDAHHNFPKVGSYNVCLIASNTCSADTTCKSFEAQDYSNSTMNAYYSFNSSSPNEWGTSICQEPSGNLLVAIDDNSYGSAGADASLMKIDQQGKILRHGIIPYRTRGKVCSLGERGYLLVTTGSCIIFLDLQSPWYNNARFLENFNPVFPMEAKNKKDIYLGGFSSASKGAVAKLNEYGNIVWAKDLAWATNVFGMVELKDGNLLVYGKSISSDAYLAKLNGKTGNMMWSKSYTTSTGVSGTSICYDSVSNHIYMSGGFNSYGLFIMKADTDGNIIWQKTMETSYAFWSRCFINQYNQLYVCQSGYTNNYIARLDTAGTVKWMKDFQGKSTGRVGSAEYTLCHDGGIAAAGVFQVGLSSNTYTFVIKTDTAGTNAACIPTPVVEKSLGYKFTSTYNGIDSVSNHGGLFGYPNITYDSVNYYSQINCASTACNTYLKYTIPSHSALTYHFEPSQPGFTISNLHWNFGDGSTSNVHSPVHTYAAPGYYNVCLSGTIAGCGNLSYCENVHIVITDVEQKEADENYLTIFPNPYIGSTTIQYNLAKKSIVTVEVYNTIGQLITTLQTGEQAQGTYSLNYEAEKNNSSGLYFLKLTVDGKTVIKRMNEVK